MTTIGAANLTGGWHEPYAYLDSLRVAEEARADREADYDETRDDALWFDSNGRTGCACGYENRSDGWHAQNYCPDYRSPDSAHYAYDGRDC